MRRIKALSGRSARRRHGLLRVEGPGPVHSLLEYHGDTVVDVFFTPDAAKRHRELWDLTAQITRYRHLVSDQVYRAVAPDSQGVFAVAKEQAIGGDLAALLETSPRLLVVLAETQDPGNMGTLIRQADAFGATGVIACIGSVDITSPKVIRASAGSVFHLPIVGGVDLAEVVAELRRNNLPLIATSGRVRLSLPELQAGFRPVKLSEPHAWLFGNEARGLTQEVLNACTAQVRIPLWGRAESLNVASAASLCLYASACEQRGVTPLNKR